VPSPQPGGSSETFLSDVAATSATNAWAVGLYYRGDPCCTPEHPLIEHWNGQAWKVVPSPNPGGSACCHGEGNILHAISSVASPSAAWAVGSFSAGSPFGNPLIEHWTGQSWTATSG